MASRDPSNFDDLIDAATRQVSNSKTSAPGRNAPPLLRPALLAIAGIGVMGLVMVLWLNLTPPGGGQVERDLDSTLDLARKAIESARTSDGALPDALPNASLASVVRYEQRGSDYKLTTVMMGMRVSIERDGKKTVEQDVR